MLSTKLLGALLPVVLNFSFVHAQTPTIEPCAAISSAQASATASTFPASLAYECLASVPIVQKDALDLLDGWAAWLEWQSDLAYLADPPEGYLYPGIDLLESVATLRERVTSGNITGELQLQTGIQAIVAASNDGHLGFLTDFQSVFSWERSIGLYAMSLDGVSLPEIYAGRDIVAELGGVIDFQPSPVVEIDGYNATELLTTFNNGFQDPDATYNSMFFQLAAAPSSTYGYFVFPTFYPGNSTTLTFQNGTNTQYPNYAISQNNFTAVVDGPTFYDMFCNATRKMAQANGAASGSGSKKTLLPHHEHNLARRQSTALKPVVISDDQTFAAWILTNTENPEYNSTAVITMSEFTFDNTTQVKSLLRQFLDLCRNQDVNHLVMDLSSNGGGSIVLAYEFMKELFPTYSPYFMRNYRAQPQFDVLGEYITNQSLHSLEETGGNRTATLAVEGMSIYDASSFLDRDGNLFDSWDALYGPVALHNDNFTHLFTWDISSVAFTTDYGPDNGPPFPITGYGDDVPPPPQPFAPENIVMLSDGQCSSSCTSLSHVMKWQGKVKSVVLGGRPQTGPMAQPGGVKGATVTYLSALLGILDDLNQEGVPRSFFTAANNTQLATIERLGEYMRYRAGVNDQYYGLNLANSILGSEAAESSTFANDEFTPLQFIYEAADCRLWYTKDMMLSREVQWIAAANQAFGFNNTTPWSGCVQGSHGHASSLSGDDKLYNGGKPNNVTGFNPPNEGNQPVDLAALGLKNESSASSTSSAGQLPSPTQSGTAAATSTANGTSVRGPYYYGTLLALLVGVWCALAIL